MALPSILSFQTLTGVIDKFVDRPDFFRSFFTNTRTHETELIRMDYIDGKRIMAPLVRRGAEAFKVNGFGFDVRYLKAPMIKVKFDINPADYITVSGPGEIPLLNVGETMVSDSVVRRINRDVTRLDDMSGQTLEWLCSRSLLEAEIIYDVAGGFSSGEGSDILSVSFNRDAGATINLATTERWGDLLGAIVATGDPTATARLARTLMSGFNGLSPSMCLMGENVGTAFQQHLKLNDGTTQTIMNMALDIRRMTLAGPVPLSGVVDPISGSIYEGTMAGIDWITYPRRIKVQMGDGLFVTVDSAGVPDGTTRDENASGTDVPLVPPNSCYFISMAPQAERWIEYGPIEDWEAVRTNTMKREKFIKSYERNDPSGATMLLETHPLPVPYRPEAVIKCNPLAAA